MDLIDFDIVNVENLAPQAYWPVDLGRVKVEATADVCRSIHPQIQLHVHAERFRRSSVKTLSALKGGGKTPVVFACVDSIDTRKLIWESLHERIGFFADGRMSEEIVRVLASDQPGVDRHYVTTLFSDSEAYAGSCTAKSTVYAAGIAAGLMLCQFTRWLRGLPVDPDVLVNLLSMEMAVA